MVRSRFAAQMELLNTELIVMGTLCENALEPCDAGFAGR